MARLVYDAIVIGSGPAGSAAGGCSLRGATAPLILARPRDRARGMAESIPPSARKLLAAISALDAVERANFPPNRGNAVWWGSTEGRLEGFGEVGEDAGFQVFRPDLDELLLAHAAAAGADLRLATARAVHFPEDSLATIEYDTETGRHTAAARFAVDCSGRVGVIARRGLRVYEPKRRMQAFLGMWRRDTGWAAGGEDRTIVETYEDGGPGRWRFPPPFARSQSWLTAQRRAPRAGRPWHIPTGPNWPRPGI